MTLPELAEYGPTKRQALYDVEGIGFNLKRQELRDMVYECGEVTDLDPENHKV